MRLDLTCRLPGLITALFVLTASSALAAVSASTVTSGAQLLGGTHADGQLGDIVLENDEIVLVIGAIGHVAYYGENGGTLIDAGTAAARSDALGELYTYFDDDWPRQARYTALTIVDDGSGGGPALVRATGHDVNDPGIAVATDYLLADGDRHLTLTTRVTAGSGALAGFELGDVFHWGSCSKYAPAYGFDIFGTTTQPWMAGLAGDVCYAYAGFYGDCWGPNGSVYSDLNVTTANIGAGATVSYTRLLAVAGGEIAAAVAVLHEALGVPTGSVACDVAAAGGGTPLAGAIIDAFDDGGGPYLQMISDGAGAATATLPAGSWRLVATAPGYDPAEQWLTVGVGGSQTAAFSLTGGGGATTAIGDTLTVIQRPLVNIPSFVLPGQTLEISCAADPAATGWQAEIIHGATTLPLPVTAASYDPTTTWWTLSATVPAVPLYELYDLRVTAAGGLDDTTRHAVRVLERFRDDYYFVHITDTHLPDHRFSDSGGTPADSTETVDLRAVIRDINLINPEFVLITGDFVNEGELEDHLEWRCYTRAQRQLYEFTTPTFLIAGNHDVGGWNDTPPPAGTARRDWWRFFGWPRLDDPPAGAPLHTQNYSFDYGPVHFTALEAYDNYDLWRAEIYGNESFPAEQLAWLNADLAAAAGSLSQVLFYHYDFQGQLNLDGLGVEMALWGHVHGDRGSEQVTPYDLATNNVCDGERSYRVIRVSGGVVQPEATVSAGASGQNLQVQFTPANDGLAATVTARITNNQPLRFENGRLRFVMPAAGGNYVATGGQVVQVDQSGPFDICHVAVDILALGSQDVTVTRGTDGVPGALPGLSLGQNHPNPFNPLTELAYTLPQDGPAKVGVYDLQGREVAVLVDEALPAGAHLVRWDGKDARGREMPSGVYLVRLTATAGEQVRKVVLAR